MGNLVLLAAFTQINWLAVTVSTVVLAGLGALYFMVIVPRQYVQVLGREHAPAPEQTALAGIGPVVCIFLTVLTSAVLLAALQIETVTEALVFGLVVGVGYLLAQTFNIAINPNFPHPLRYGLLNTPYFLLGSLITSLAVVLL